ncbi:MAG: G1 family glutamic endopeptidase [Ktedonobacterales bacterium]
MHRFFTHGRRLVPLPIITLVLIAVLLSGAAHPTRVAAQSSAHRNAPLIHLHNRETHSTSSNWSGYTTTGDTYFDIRGSWTQPAVSCSAGQTAYSSFWLGIDGYTTVTVEQIGTDADCINGTPTYYAWYEMYPKFPVNFSNPVRPGDHMHAEVKASDSRRFVLTIGDTTRGWSRSIIQRLRIAPLGSAEWIAEAPSGATGALPLADFHTVRFTNCTANGHAISSTSNPDALTMADNGVTKAQPSSLSSGGSAFNVTWDHR